MEERQLEVRRATDRGSSRRRTSAGGSSACPTTAAAYATTTISVRLRISRFRTGAIRMPATAASDAPIAHDSKLMRAGDAPFSAARLRSSTTARIATPVRVRFSRYQKTTAMTPATIDRDHLVRRHEDARQTEATARRRTQGTAGLRGPDALGERPSASPSVRSSRRATCRSRVRARLRISTRSITAPIIGAKHEDDHDERERRRPAVVEPQLPVRERHEHADAAVREVEDAGRRVRQDETARRDA